MRLNSELVYQKRWAWPARIVARRRGAASFGGRRREKGVVCGVVKGTPMCQMLAVAAESVLARLLSWCPRE